MLQSRGRDAPFKFPPRIGTPPIRHNIRVIEVDGLQVVAVIVQASHNRPHFAGPAFVRVGSQSKNASTTEFEELIASRSSKAWPLLEAKRTGEAVTVANWHMGRNRRDIGADVKPNCVVVECTARYVVFEVLINAQTRSGVRLSGDYDQITLKRNANGQLQVDIDG
jgi:hypothetical protein